VEEKIVLYDSNNNRLGQTFSRRARQLVNQQKAMWIDDSQTAIRFHPGMESTDRTVEQPAIQLYQVCFAPWGKHYYPAVIVELLPGHARAAYLDGDSDLVPTSKIMGLQEGFEILEFQGMLVSHDPLIIQYKNGEVEQTDLSQLRGKIPKTIYMNNA